MQTSYRDRVAQFLEQACPLLSATQKLRFKNLFGAVGGYVDVQLFDA
jgi:hypothetical protein